MSLREREREEKVLKALIFVEVPPYTGAAGLLQGSPIISFHLEVRCSIVIFNCWVIHRSLLLHADGS